MIFWMTKYGETRTNAPHGRNKNYPDGMSWACKLCRSEYDANSIPTDWKEVNRRRRQDPEYRQKEREKSNARDKERRKTEYKYMLARSESNRKWKNSGDVEEKKEKARKRKRKKYYEERAKLTPEELDERRKRKQESIDYIRGLNKAAFARQQEFKSDPNAPMILINLKAPDR